MKTVKPVVIVGGGLAGLTLGIGLRQQGIPVTIWEAAHYPRHRVCGEFISGRGQAALERLALRKSIFEAGAVSARTAAFFLGNVPGPVRPLDQPAWCLSRFTLDALLAEVFCERGGELKQGQRWPGNDWPEGVVQATGRRACPVDNGWRWFGLKVHARRVLLEADLELHGMTDCYVGLCRLSDGETNVCGLFRRGRATAGAPGAWQEILRGPPGSPLRGRMAQAEFDERTFCSVAGLDLRPRRARHRPECCIGDSLTMLPPVTGNGMSMAVEAAELAVAPLAAWSQGTISWPEARESIAGSCDRAFSQRLAWARALQWLMFAPALRGPFGKLVLGSDWLWRLTFNRTR